MTENPHLPGTDPDGPVVEALMERCGMTEEEARRHVAEWDGWEHTPSLPPQPISPLEWPAA